MDPKIRTRMLNHWDNVYPKVDIERGYGGESLFRWDDLGSENPDTERLEAYARLLSSVGINALVLNNVNVGEMGSQLIQLEWLPRLARVADLFRAWGIQIGLAVSYAAPKMLKELETADPREAAVCEWWKARCDALYEAVPDLLGFLVKADCEHQPGPMDYGLDHAQGAQHLADALAPHGGVLIWRAFVYTDGDKTDVMAQPYKQFTPLDDKFAENVILQIKNGPRDFQPYEPVHPLFGGMKQTSMALELQVTQEYLGHDTHICFIPTQWEIYFKSQIRDDATLADVLCASEKSLIAGVANTNDNPNWTGHLFAQANLYGFARLCWDPYASSETIAHEWALLTFDGKTEAISTTENILNNSWRAFVGYTSPFNMGQFFNQADTWDADHFDPAPWFKKGKDYFHPSAEEMGFERSRGDDIEYVSQYPKELKELYQDPKTCPEDTLLFFHRLPWNWKIQNGKTLMQAVYDSYHDNAAKIDAWISDWTALAGTVDPYRHAHVLERLQRQRYHARLWARYMTSYFLGLTGIPDDSGRSY